SGKLLASSSHLVRHRGRSTASRPADRCRPKELSRLGCRDMHPPRAAHLCPFASTFFRCLVRVFRLVLTTRAKSTGVRQPVLSRSWLFPFVCAIADEPDANRLAPSRSRRWHRHRIATPEIWHSHSAGRRVFAAG